jgi:short-subunit dehydrogenase
MLKAGQTAAVTGAGSGIGRAVALALARMGLRVLLIGRDEAKLRATAEASKPHGEPIAADITTPEGRAAVAHAVGDALHVMVHAAGAWAQTPLRSLSLEAWRALDAVNLHAPMLLTMACIDHLRAANGHIIFINSTAALRPGPTVAAYAAGKAALRAASEALRQELSGQGVRVLNVFPGRTATPMQETVLAAEGRVAPPGALMRPEDVATMVIAALSLSDCTEVTEIVMRPARAL